MWVKGIYVPKGSTFTIYGQSDGEDAGMIDSHPSSGAGIGATSDNHPGGNVVIHGGIIKATGYDHCAGIGGNDGNEKDIGDFTMYGGTVIATGGSSSAGIGGGRACEGGKITIYDGTVTATGAHYGAGIGGGNGQDTNPLRGAHAGTITIWGGIITATGDNDAAGIGGGEGGNAGKITINGGTITATGGDNGAGIGCGEGETTVTGGSVTINGGTVTATGGDYAAGIGGGYNTCEDYDDQHGYCDNISINGGNVIANGGCRAAAIGAGAWSDSGTIYISGGKITANADSDNGIGIGSAHNSWGGTRIEFSYSDKTRDDIEIMQTKYYGNVYFWNNFTSPYTGESFGTGELLNEDFIEDKRLVAYRWTSTTYRTADGTEKSTEGIPVREDSYTWRGGNNTFIVDQDVDLDHQVELRANTTLILNDGCTLNVRNIKVEKKYTLTIYGQDKGTGIVITTPDNFNRSGIGGAYTDCGTITINGGTVIATGGSDPSTGCGSAGIGAAYDQPAGTVNINGGTVVATGGAGAQGIGSTNKAKGKTNLSYTDYTCDKMSVTASSFDGTVKLDKPFMDKADGTVFPATESVSDLNILAGRTLVPMVVVLADNADNTTAIATAATACTGGNTLAVKLQGRKLYKDGAWNTLCLPFSTELTGDLADADIRALSSASLSSDGVLTLNFTAEGDVTSITAGQPYIVKWAGSEGQYVESPVFNGVTISSTAPATDVKSTDGKVQFLGTYSPAAIANGNKACFFLGGANTLYYPDADGFEVGAFRPYFKVDLGNGLGVYPAPQSVRQFVLNFGEEDTQGIKEIDDLTIYDLRFEADAWYNLNGRKVAGVGAGALGDSQSPVPTRLRKGLYIVNGKKVVVP